MQLTESIRRQVVDGILEGKYRPGDKLPTERGMAELTSTSRITVRRAYGQLEQAGIIERKTKTGTTVAETFRGNSDAIDLVAVITTLDDQFSRVFLEALHAACAANDALLVLAVAKERAAEQDAQALKLAAKGVKNIVVWGFDKSIDTALFQRLRILGVNSVFFDRVVPADFADFVGLDNRHAIQTLMDAAAATGPCAFANIAGLNIDSNAERERSFLDECRRRKLPHSLFQIPWDALDTPAAEQFCRVFFASRGKDLPAAVVCVNDRVALAVKAACPTGVEVYSVDGTAEALAAGIVTYSQPIGMMAAATVRALESQRREGKDWQPRQYRFKGELLTP